MSKGKIKSEQLIYHIWPHRPQSLCSHDRSLSCWFVCGTLRWAVGSLPGAGVPGNYLPPASGRGRRLPCRLVPLGAYIPLPPLGTEAGRKGKGCSSVRANSLPVWESFLFLSQDSWRVPRTLLASWLPGFQNHLYSPHPVIALLSHVRKNHLKLGNRKTSWQNVFSATLGLAFYHL